MTTVIHTHPTHPHLAFADFIRLLPIVTFADPHIRLLPMAENLLKRLKMQPLVNLHIHMLLWLKI